MLTQGKSFDEARKASVAVHSELSAIRANAHAPDQHPPPGHTHRQPSPGGLTHPRGGAPAALHAANTSLAASRGAGAGAQPHHTQTLSTTPFTSGAAPAPHSQPFTPGHATPHLATGAGPSTAASTMSRAPPAHARQASPQGLDHHHHQQHQQQATSAGRGATGKGGVSLLWQTPDAEARQARRARLEAALREEQEAHEREQWEEEAGRGTAASRRGHRGAGRGGVESPAYIQDLKEQVRITCLGEGEGGAGAQDLKEQVRITCLGEGEGEAGVQDLKEQVRITCLGEGEGEAGVQDLKEQVRFSLLGRGARQVLASLWPCRAYGIAGVACGGLVGPRK